eukprot:CAMPEP_0194058866 /NCGR_PEP_ID=MMETSP0009_2-20130614/67464_1 /TAXON_ID=210454 /ORGANISM="Grammatophora oceanica, Strain CCMP 410" /LENGTH=50 /DNA_ID=CAMNT_0038709171 /DNA_START=419 /DNA_END=568 /DNA_ORIENTATION=+
MRAEQLIKTKKKCVERNSTGLRQGALEDERDDDDFRGGYVQKNEFAFLFW